MNASDPAEIPLIEVNHRLRARVAELEAELAALRGGTGLKAHQTLQEPLYRAIGEAIDYGVWVCASDGRNIYASQSFLNLVGLTQEQCSDFGWGSVLHPDDAEQTIAAWKDCVRTGGKWDMEHRFRGADGKWHYVLARGVPVRDADGRLACWAGINLDIDALKQAEESARQREAALDAFFAASPSMLAIVDEHFRPMKTDRSTREFLELMPGLLPVVKRVLEAETPEKNVEIRSPEGSSCWRVSCFPVPLPGGTRGVGIAGVEITDLRKAEEALLQSEERQRLFIEHVPAAVAMFDRDMRYLAVSERWIADYRLESRDLIGRSHYEVFPELPAKWKEVHRRCLAGAVECCEEEAFPRADGSIDWLRWEVHPWRNIAGEVAGIIIFSEQITERKRLEEQLRERAEELQAVMDAAPAAIWVAHDPECHEITGNRMANWFYEAEEGENVSAGPAPGEPVPPRRFFRNGRELPAEELPMQVAAARGIDVRYSELEVVLPSGRRISISGGATPLRDGAGRVRGCVAAFQDTTARKRMEEELRTSESILRSFFDSPGVIRGIIESVDGVLVHVSCNEAGAAILGVDRASVAGRPLVATGFPAELAAMLAAKCEESRRVGKPVSFEAVLVSPRGRSILFCTVCHIGSGPYGNPRFAYTSVDVTEHRWMTRTLDALTAASSDHLYMLDRERRYTYANPAGLRAIGKTAVEFVGKTWREIGLPREVMEQFETEVDRVFETGNSAGGELVFPTVDGPRQYEYVINPVREATGQVDAVAISVRDITDRRETAAQLRELVQRLTYHVDNSPLAVIEWGPDMRLIRWSGEAERIFGWKAEEVLGKHMEDFRWICLEDALQVAEVSAQLRSGADRRGFSSNRNYRKDGSIAHCEWYNSSLLDEHGNLQSILSLVLDVTARKQAEQALRDSEDKFRTLADSIPQLAWMTDEKGWIFWYNRRWYDYTGTTLEEMEGWGWRRVHHPDHVERVDARWKRQLQLGEAWEDTFPLRGKDGQYRWFLSRAMPIRDSEGRVVRWIGTNTDITERQEAEERLRRSEQRFRRLYEADIVGIVAADADNVFDANDVFLKAAGYTREEFEAGRVNWRSLTVPEYLPLDRKAMEELAASGSCKPFEKEFFRKDGSRFPVLIGATVLERTPLRWLCFILDLTERKQLERRVLQAQKLESIGLLAGGIAHDFNNLLVAVIGNASLAQDMLPTGSTESDLLTQVIRTGEQAAHLTRQLLAYSGKGRFVIEPVNISELIPEMSGLVQPSISKKITLHLDLAPDLPAIDADRGQLQQIFMNLVINAAEAIGNETGLISVATSTRDVDEQYIRNVLEGAEVRPGRYVCLEVRDTGCGMDEATAARIFDPFFSTKFTGRGLGLAAVAGIIRGHSGAVKVSSRPGKGSCFTVLFPASESTETAGRERLGRAGLRGHGTVLVVDDEIAVRETVKKSLERYGYRVLPAESGQAALDVLKRHPGEIQLAILDLSMPGMSGEEVLPAMRRIRPDIRVLVTSGYSETETLAMFGGQRVAGFIQKPFTAAALAERVQAATHPEK